MKAKVRTVKLKNLKGKKIEPTRIRIQDAFDEFLNALENRGLRERTLREHRIHLEYFLKFCKEYKIRIEFIDDVTTQICRKYIDYMKNKKRKWDDHEHLKRTSDQKGLAPGTVLVRTRTLRAQFNWYVKQGWLKESPWSTVEQTVVDEQDLVTFSKKEIRMLIHAPSKDTFVGFRARTVFNLLFDSGIRVGELVALDESDVDFERGTLLVRATTAKGRRPRRIPLSDTTLFMMKKLIDENNRLEFREPALFLSVNGRRLGTSDIRHMIRKYGKEVGIEGVRLSPHTFRHTFATEYILSGGDIHSLQVILSHQDAQTTRRYFNAGTETLKYQHKQHSPLSSKRGRKAVCR